MSSEPRLHRLFRFFSDNGIAAVEATQAELEALGGALTVVNLVDDNTALNFAAAFTNLPAGTFYYTMKTPNLTYYFRATDGLACAEKIFSLIRDVRATINTQLGVNVFAFDNDNIDEAEKEPASALKKQPPVIHQKRDTEVSVNDVLATADVNALKTEVTHLFWCTHEGLFRWKWMPCKAACSWCPEARRRDALVKRAREELTTVCKALKVTTETAAALIAPIPSPHPAPPPAPASIQLQASPPLKAAVSVQVQPQQTPLSPEVVNAVVDQVMRDQEKKSQQQQQNQRQPRPL